MSEVKKFQSIGKKLFLAIGLSAAAVLLPTFGIIFYNVYNGLKESEIHAASVMTEIMGENLKAAIEFDDQESAEIILKSFELNSGVDGALVYNAKKELVASYKRESYELDDLKRFSHKLYHLKGFKEKSEYMGEESILVSRPIRFGEAHLGTLFVKLNTSNLELAKEKLYTLLFIVLMLSLVAIFIAEKRISKMVTTPINHLKKAMAKGEKKSDLDTQINATTNDEFQILFNGFNRMVAQIQEQNETLQNQKEFVETLINSQEQLILTTNGKELLSANTTFLDFFAIDSHKDFYKEYGAKCICELFDVSAPEGYLQKEMDGESWIDYIVARSFADTHKVKIVREGTEFIFSVSGAKLPGVDGVKSAVFTNITEMEQAKRQVEEMHKHTRDSIEYASQIQGALIPDNELFRKYFKEYFTIWHPKDTVGGDIYLFEELRDDDECLLLVIDCTGHGVPGAFVTMLVKAVERQIVARIKHSDEVVSPAKILSIFNSSMKHLLKQQDSSATSNAGFDGQVVYYNKKDKIVKCASARNDIFYYQNSELKTIKGDRHSIGYRDSDANYEFKEHTIDVSEESVFYLLTDGYLDQNGGTKEFPFGKKRFKAMLEEIHNESMADQQEEFLYTLESYRNGLDVNDDVTAIGIKI
jgi:HAMP domain-containing protein